MTARRHQVLDAAIRVLGTRGTRQLTHRAVDAEAQLPQGSTSNYFRNRDALLSGVLDRLVVLDDQAWGMFSADLGNTTLNLDTFTDAFTQFAVELALTARTPTLARQAILLESAHHDHLRNRVRARTRRLLGWGAPWLRRLGSPRPERDFADLRALLDGLLLQQCVHPEPDFDPAPAVHALLHGMSARW